MGKLANFTCVNSGKGCCKNKAYPPKEILVNNVNDLQNDLYFFAY